MFSKGQLNLVLKWEKPWQIYLHARMAPTWPLEEQSSEKTSSSEEEGLLTKIVNAVKENETVKMFKKKLLG